MTDLEPQKMSDHLEVVYVEDDPRLGRLTAQYLGTHGVVVSVVSSGAQALGEVMRVAPDLVLLDLMLPGIDGVQICRQIRERSSVPILMVTARTEEVDRVIGLEAGADDYIHKPFSTRELLARIRASVRRARGLVGPAAQRLAVGTLMMDTGRMTATLDGRHLELTTYEFALLRAFAERPGQVLGRERLLELVQGSSEDAFDRSVDVHISRLRQKLEKDSRKPRYLKTVRGAGYVLVGDAL